MKILQICKKFPYPQKDGETIAIHNLTKSLHQLGHEVTVLAINTPKHFFNTEALPEHMKAQANYDAVFIDTSIRAIDAFRNLFSSKSYNIERFNHPSFHQKIKECLEKEVFDIIQLEGLFLTPYLSTIRKHSKAPVVMRAHNVEFEIWERLAENEKNFLKKQYLKLLSRRMRNYELGHLNHYDALVPISDKDAAFFKSKGATKPIVTVVSGVDTDKLKVNKEHCEFPSIFHLGALDWLPNQEALYWFFDHIWPSIHKAFPELKFEVAGRNATDEMLNLKIDAVEIIGEVDDAVDYMNSRSIMVVPLLSGSGMRIKIMEALALGKTIVSTSVGAEGIEVQDKKEILIANNAADFIQAIKKCLKDKAYCEEIGENAAIFVRSNYDNLKLAKALTEFYEKL